MLRIYGSAKSRGLRVLWMVGELGLEYDHKNYLPRSPETQTPEFRDLNANARVPVIDDDGFVLSESMAINLYLAKKHKSPLYPRISPKPSANLTSPKKPGRKWSPRSTCSSARSPGPSGSPVRHSRSPTSTSLRRSSGRSRSICKSGRAFRRG
jgi:hypothetical protein